jgi:hypothetical protein
MCARGKRRALVVLPGERSGDEPPGEARRILEPAEVIDRLRLEE